MNNIQMRKIWMSPKCAEPDALALVREMRHGLAKVPGMSCLGGACELNYSLFQPEIINH
jgi:hypothetical protein